MYHVIKGTEIRHGLSEITKNRVERTSSPYKAIRTVTITKSMWCQGKVDGYFYRITWRTVSGEVEKCISLEKLESDGEKLRVVEKKPPRGRAHPHPVCLILGEFPALDWLSTRWRNALNLKNGRLPGSRGIKMTHLRRNRKQSPSRNNEKLSFSKR